MSVNAALAPTVSANEAVDPWADAMTQAVEMGPAAPPGAGRGPV